MKRSKVHISGPGTSKCLAFLLKKNYVNDDSIIRIVAHQFYIDWLTLSWTEIYSSIQVCCAGKQSMGLVTVKVEGERITVLCFCVSHIQWQNMFAAKISTNSVETTASLSQGRSIPHAAPLSSPTGCVFNFYYAWKNTKWLLSEAINQNEIMSSRVD